MMKMNVRRWALAGAIAACGYGTAALADDPSSTTSTTIQQEPLNDQSDMSQNKDQLAPDYMAPPDYQTNVTTTTTSGAAAAPSTGGSGTRPEYVTMTKKEHRHAVGGPSSAGYLPGILTVGGGVEGQTGDLSNQLRPGPTWGASLAVQPLSFMGLEAAYSGATANQDNRLSGGNSDGLANGADIIRNGGQAAVTVLAPTPVIQPYALGGIGIDRYNYRGDSPVFKDDTAGRVPVGGLKANLGHFVADAQGTYNVLFDDDFSNTNPNRGGTYDIALNLGARF